MRYQRRWDCFLKTCGFAEQLIDLANQGEVTLFTLEDLYK